MMEEINNEVEEVLGSSLEEASPSLDPNHARFSDADWYDPNYTVLIGGVGGIGSWLTLFLSRAGYTIHVFDMDNIDETNLAGQFYKESDIGKSKVEAVKELCSAFSRNDLITHDEKYTERSMSNNFVFSCFDNMEARKVMFERWIELWEYNKEAGEEVDMLFVDGRMTAETGQIFFVTPERIEEYRKTLFDDSEVADLACSYKATTHNGAFISSNMMAGFTNFITNLKVGSDIREVPFRVDYMLHLLNYKVTSYEN